VIVSILLFKEDKELNLARLVRGAGVHPEHLRSELVGKKRLIHKRYLISVQVTLSISEFSEFRSQ
jgi:hypothetical protein